jgi:hypothetical protein
MRNVNPNPQGYREPKEHFYLNKNTISTACPKQNICLKMLLKLPCKISLQTFFSGV